MVSLTVMVGSRALLTWDELQRALAAGVRAPYRAQGGGTWPDGAGMPRPPAASAPPTKPAP